MHNNGFTSRLYKYIRHVKIDKCPQLCVLSHITSADDTVTAYSGERTIVCHKFDILLIHEILVQYNMASDTA